MNAAFSLRRRDFGAWLALSAAGAAQAQAPAWPHKPIRILVGFPGGSTPDMAARVLAEAMGRAFGQAVVVDNRPGASGNIAADQVAKANDDHTLGVVINGNLTSAKLLTRTLVERMLLWTWPPLMMEPGQTILSWASPRRAPLPPSSEKTNFGGGSCG